jgi:hypothetical protein
MHVARFFSAPALATAALLGATSARAFCGFYVAGNDAPLYNNATQVVLMREGTRTVLAMQNNYEGPAAGFAMVVPVPVVLQKANVKTLPRELFAKVDQLDAPRLVEYWEQDPCYVPPPAKSVYYDRMESAGAARTKDKSDRESGVKVEARFSVGEYDIVILSAKDASGLEGWLQQEKYAIPSGAAPYLRPYVQSGSKFFVAKVDPAKVVFQRGMAKLSPLRFHYDAENFSLPVRLGLMNAKGAQDLIVHILAQNQRYEVTNYPNVAIPTNFDVTEKTKGNFGAFYAALFDETVKRHPKAVVTEYSWDATTCDPCPGPALDQEDFLTLGADVLGGEQDYHSRSNGGFTVTRLHARYTKDSLGEDLYFRAAPPIVGGREMRQEGGKLEQGAHPDQTNNFQGRYSIRHPWTGPIACKNPVRGIWGEPPANVPDANRSHVQPVADTAFARRDLSLASFATNVPAGNLLGAAAAAPGPTGASVEPVAESDAGGPGGPPPTPAPRGCGGCNSGAGSESVLASLLALVTLAVVRQRRKR